MKQHLQQLLADALKALPASAEHPELADLLPELERTRDRRHGDFASNLALEDLHFILSHGGEEPEED